MKSTRIIFSILSTLLVSSIAMGQTKLGQVSNFFASGGFTITVQLDAATSMATITFESDNNEWAAIGFDAQSMGDLPYTIVDLGDGTIIERKLGDHSGGTVLTTLSTLVSSNDAGGIRKTVVTRAFDLGDPNFYTFDFNSESINIIMAVGSSTNFGYHGNQNKAPEILVTKIPLGLVVEPLGVAINEFSTPPDLSAVLDINSADQGILFPRVNISSLDSPAPVNNPAEGLVIYNTSNNTGPGLFIWDGSEWMQLITQSGLSLNPPPAQPIQSSQASQSQATMTELLQRLNDLESKVKTLEKENKALKKYRKKKNAKKKIH